MTYCHLYLVIAYADVPIVGFHHGPTSDHGEVIIQNPQMSSYLFT